MSALGGSWTSEGKTVPGNGHPHGVPSFWHLSGLIMGTCQGGMICFRDEMLRSACLRGHVLILLLEAFLSTAELAAGKFQLWLDARGAGQIRLNPGSPRISFPSGPTEPEACSLLSVRG